MTGFEPWTPGNGTNCCAKCDTTTAQLGRKNNFFSKFNLILFSVHLTIYDNGFITQRNKINR